jgi:hypothetical protein
MNFERSILAELRQWSAREKHKPLVLRGARQVGKTTAVQLFAREFDHFISLNLEQAEDREFFTRFNKLEDAVAAIPFQTHIALQTLAKGTPLGQISNPSILHLSTFSRKKSPLTPPSPP